MTKPDETDQWIGYSWKEPPEEIPLCLWDTQAYVDSLIVEFQDRLAEHLANPDEWTGSKVSERNGEFTAGFYIGGIIRFAFGAVHQKPF